METTPTELKKQNILLFMTPRQRLAFALTSKKQMEWMAPILRFMELPVGEKIAFINTSQRSRLTDDLIVEALSKETDNVLLNILSGLPDNDANKKLKSKIQDAIETRLCDRNYKKLIKKTLLKTYIQYLLRGGRSVASFINRIKSPEVRSQAIEQYLLLTRNELTPNTLKKWVERIPDQYTRNKTRRVVQKTIS